MEYFKYRSNFSNYVINEEENLAKVYQGEAIPIENRVNLGYGDDPEKYLQSGERDTTRMLDILGKNNVALEPGSSILDFGCGSARMLRWVQKLAPDCEYWGCDAEAKSIIWAQNNLDESLKLFTSVKEPHLPFMDSSHDLIYASSVFSHIDDLADMWLLELKRITKPGGKLYLTFQDDNSLKIINEQNTDATKTYHNKLYLDNNIGDYLKTNYKKIVVDRTNYSCQVFYSQSWLTKHLSKYFSQVTCINEGYGWQTAFLLEK